VRNRRSIAWAAAVLGASLVVSGCGSGGSGNGPTVAEPLRIGTLVPHTGAMAQVGPAEAAGIAMAAHDVNAAGGVLGQPISIVDGDSGDVYSSIASQSVDNELAAKVQAIVGATGSSVTLTVIDKIVGAGVVEISPGDASTALSSYPDDGLYFRTVPADTAEATVLSDRIRQAGHTSVAIVVVHDLYGTGLADELKADIESWHGHAVQIQYDGRAQSFVSTVAQVSASGAQAVVLIGFAETVKIIREMVKEGVGPAVLPLYLSDLALSNVLAAELAPGTMAGAEGVRPGGPASASFLARLAAQASGLTDVGYAAQAYDSVVLLSLAAQAAQSTRGKAIAAQLPAITHGRARCQSYQDCLKLLRTGNSITYVGASGPLPLTAGGNLGSGQLGIFRFGPNGTYPPTGLAYVTKSGGTSGAAPSQSSSSAAGG